MEAGLTDNIWFNCCVAWCGVELSSLPEYPMSSVPIYQIACPNGHTTQLPETILDKIIPHLQESDRKDPVLNFVCSDCKTAFHFDYQNRARAGSTNAPHRIEEFHVCVVQTGCDGSNCADHVELIAVRNRDISEESIQQEMKMWNVSAVKCKGGRRALPMGTPKRSWIQPFAGGL